MDYYSFYKDTIGVKVPDLLDKLVEIGMLRHYSQGSYILHTGDVLNQIFILVKGVVRGVVLNEEGNEKIDRIVHEPGSFMLSSFCSFLMDVPSQQDLVATTDTYLIALPMKFAISLLEEEVEIKDIVIRELQHAVDRNWKLQLILKKSSAKDKYQWFLENYPGIIHKISNKYVADFLGMDPATLSKLKNKHY